MKSSGRKQFPIDETLSVSKAGPEDLEQFLSILDQSEEWMARNNINLWKPGHNRQYAKFFQEQLERGLGHLVWIGSDLIGAFLFGPPNWLDHKMWEELSDNAFYLHRLALLPDHIGKGYGRKLIDWAASRALDAGCLYLRTTVYEDNPFLCRYFEKAGFQNHGVVRGPGWISVLYERPLKRP